MGIPGRPRSETSNRSPEMGPLPGHHLNNRSRRAKRHPIKPDIVLQWSDGRLTLPPIGPECEGGTMEDEFQRALDRLVEQVRSDRSILAVILCGSLAHDRVWARSDIDLVLVTIDDRKVERGGLSLYADRLNVHAVLLPRGEFRRTVERATHNSIMHSFLVKGRLLYTHDETITDLCARLREIGGRDVQAQFLRAGTGALGAPDRASSRRDQDGRSRDRPGPRGGRWRRRGRRGGDTGSGRRVQVVAHGEVSQGASSGVMPDGFRLNAPPGRPSPPTSS